MTIVVFSVYAWKFLQERQHVYVILSLNDLIIQNDTICVNHWILQTLNWTIILFLPSLKSYIESRVYADVFVRACVWRSNCVAPTSPI